jgi:hypothetical protein
VVEGAALEKRCTVFPYREFESPSLRQENASHVYYMAGFLLEERAVRTAEFGEAKRRSE